MPMKTNGAMRSGTPPPGSCICSTMRLLPASTERPGGDRATRPPLRLRAGGKAARDSRTAPVSRRRGSKGKPRRVFPPAPPSARGPASSATPTGHGHGDREKKRPSLMRYRDCETSRAQFLLAALRRPVGIIGPCEGGSANIARRKSIAFGHYMSPRCGNVNPM